MMSTYSYVYGMCALRRSTFGHVLGSFLDSTNYFTSARELFSIAGGNFLAGTFRIK